MIDKITIEKIKEIRTQFDSYENDADTDIKVNPLQYMAMLAFVRSEFELLLEFAESHFANIAKKEEPERQFYQISSGLLCFGVYPNSKATSNQELGYHTLNQMHRDIETIKQHLHL